MLTAGVDIGSRSSKAVILEDDKVIATSLSLESYLSVADRGSQVLSKALESVPYSQEDIDCIVATGYGRISAPYANTTVTEITCHAKGVHALVPSVRTIIDIGGQDSKVIKLNEKGDVIDFAMNDRCAAGTGKFLEVTAKAMKLELSEFSSLFFETKKPKPISSMCTVFAESEVVSLLADSVPPKEIVAGLIQAVARRVGNMAKRLGVVDSLVFTGGVAKNSGVMKAIEDTVGHKFTHFDFDPQLVGAFGAAVIAREQEFNGRVKKKVRTLRSIDKLHYALECRQEEIVSLKKSGKKIIGYFCSYVPEEIIYALGFIPIRLIRGGNVDAANVGNEYLSSNACPYASSCVGFKENGQDFYFSHADIIADAPSCYQMKRVLEIWEQYFNTRVVHVGLPRTFYEPKGLRYFIVNLKHFVEELEEISGKKLDKKKLETAVELYNDIQTTQQEIYQLLKLNKIRWGEGIQFIHAGFILDRKAYLDLMRDFVKEVKETKKPLPEMPIRILITGSMLAPGDHKVVDIFNELGFEFAMDELCAGSRCSFRKAKEATLESIAESYLENVPCGAFPYPYANSDPRQIHIEKLIQEYRIQGILHYTLRFCDAYSYKTGNMKKICESMNIPMLHLHSDYSESDKGQLKTRIEAFKEAIEQNIDSKTSSEPSNPKYPVEVF